MVAAQVRSKPGRADYSEKPQDRAIVQASFLDMAEKRPLGMGPPGSGRRRVKRVDLSLRQTTFAEIDEAWV